MNTTPPEVESGFDPHKVRGIADVKRSSDDRMVAGAILYVAGWLLLPADNEDKSIAARLFKLDDNEKQFRVVGLIVLGIIGIIASIWRKQ